ncbi:MAG: hypothetical protein IKZ47_06115 [Clostridia bacterium]|nr:hypothetical protein [Clostridia bacterium]
MPEEEMPRESAEETKEEKPEKNTFFAVAAAECVLAAGVIIAVLILKFFFCGTFYAARQWYRENAAVDTDPGEIINGAENEVQTV